MNLYHIINRGIDGRKLFLDSQDYVRFIHNLYEFNDTLSAIESVRRSITDTHVGHRMSHMRVREQLVKIHGWVLMDNHYHLLISETKEGGLLKFMRKVNVGYAKYYNERYVRSGHLFQGKTKKILIENHSYFLYILHYIHLNPLDYFSSAEKWRERDKGTISNIPKILEYLQKYRWSSYLDYCGKPNFPSILTTSLFDKALGESYSSSVKEYLNDRLSGDGLDQKSLEY